MLKKGDLLNVVGGVILAVVCLLVVFGFAVKLYNIRTNQEDENAKKTLDLLLSKIELLQNGQSTNITLQGFDGSKGWAFTGWNKSIDTRLKPQKCFFESCICICKGGFDLRSLKEYLPENCQDSGFCRSLPKTDVAIRGEFVYISSIIDSPPGQAQHVTNKAVDEIRNYIPLEKNLFELQIEKRQSSISLYKLFRLD